MNAVDFESKAMSYIKERLTLSEEAEQLIDNILRCGLAYTRQSRLRVLKQLLSGIDLSEHEIKCFAAFKLPRKVQYPVEVRIERQYRVWVTADENDLEKRIMDKCRREIISKQGNVLEEDIDCEIEDEDIKWMYIDSEGCQEVDEE